MRGRGRGGGGGRGRSGPPGGPVVREEDGTVVPSQPMGPPPTFPEMELPEHTELSAKDTLLLLRRHDLINNSKKSPFYIDGPKRLKDGPDAGMEPERHSDRTSKAQTRRRPPMSSVLTLIPEYFPEELYGTTERALKRKTQAAFWKYNGKKEDGSGLQRLDQLAQLESKAQGGPGGSGAGGSGGAAADDEAPVEDEPVDTDDEEDMENDDYYQGKDFDDDDGYGDDGDDGDDGPIY